MFIVALASAGGAAYSGYRVHEFVQQSSWLSQRSHAEGDTYVSTLSADYANAQLDTFDRRRLLVAETAHWRRIELIALIGAVLFGFAAYVMRAIATIHPIEEGQGLGVSGGGPEKAPAH